MDTPGYGSLESFSRWLLVRPGGFNRVPTFLVVAARRFLASPRVHLFDDFKIVDLDGGGA